MGNIMKINLYAEYKGKEEKEINLQKIEEAIFQYNNWIKKTDREDKIENYEEFLQVQ